MSDRPIIEPLVDLPGVVRAAASRELLGPRLAIVGAVHGNERCGLQAIERLERELSNGELRLKKGTLYLVHGNPQATEERLRYSTRGADLNRLFDYQFVGELEESHWRNEHYRALALRPLLESVDALLDLHSATAPTPPFAIASSVAASRQLADALGLEYVTVGWEGPGLLGDKVMTAALTKRDCAGVAVECGQHDDPAAPAVAYRVALRALLHLGMVEAELPRTRPPIHLAIRAAIKRPSPTFRFTRPLQGMQCVEAGEVIAAGDYLALTVRTRCHVIMPNDDVPVGDDLLYLAEQLSDQELPNG